MLARRWGSPITIPRQIAEGAKGHQQQQEGEGVPACRLQLRNFTSTTTFTLPDPGGK